MVSSFGATLFLGKYAEIDYSDGESDIECCLSAYQMGGARWTVNVANIGG